MNMKHFRVLPVNCPVTSQLLSSYIIMSMFMILQVDSSWTAGDYEGARRSSRNALYMNIATIVVGIILGIVAGVISGISS
jgi:LytS/YehU family sensor histidine kinase